MKSVNVSWHWNNFEDNLINYSIILWGGFRQHFNQVVKYNDSTVKVNYFKLDTPVIDQWKESTI